MHHIRTWLKLYECDTEYVEDEERTALQRAYREYQQEQREERDRHCQEMRALESKWQDTRTFLKEQFRKGKR